tara:strand:+ start:367 stop:1146 length:780 start_codon:yes stop_codon:yes gene_type:complete
VGTDVLSPPSPPPLRPTGRRRDLTPRRALHGILRVHRRGRRGCPYRSHGGSLRRLGRQGLIASRQLRGFAASAGTIAEAASALEQQYARPLQALHWLIAGGTVGTFAFVQLAMNLPKEQAEDKGRFMMLHKSLGLTVLALSVPRLALRLTTKIPAAVPGSQIEQVAAKVGHLVMYGFMTAMPVSGFIMGYYGGKGLPFFGVTIPGASKRDGKLAGRAFKLHKQLGWYYEMFVPLHVGAVGVHALKGQNILRRMGVTAFG